MSTKTKRKRGEESDQDKNRPNGKQSLKAEYWFKAIKCFYRNEKETQQKAYEITGGKSKEIS